MAGRFLWSYIKLTEDKNLEVATKAVITLYRMGDCKAVALVKMRQWIESGLKCYYTDAVAETSDSKDIRQQILVELDFYKDRSLDETIHAVWSRNRNEEGKDVWSVDYGYYLEKHGKALPEEYWMRRLDSPYNFLSALEVIEVRKPAGWSEKLQAVFAELSTKRGPSPQASRARGYAARVASTLFRLSGKTDYLDYLVSRGESELVSEDFDSSLSNVLDGLAQTGDPVALKVVSGGMKHKNQVVREMVLHAMGLTQSPDATELLFQEAMNEAKMGLSFPNRQLRALLEQRTPLADVRYDQLKNALLGGHVAWTAVSSDFAHLEFFRKHRH